MAGNIYSNNNNIGTSIYVILFFVWYLHFFHGNIATYKDKKNQYYKLLKIIKKNFFLPLSLKSEMDPMDIGLLTFPETQVTTLDLFSALFEFNAIWIQDVVGVGLLEN